MKIRLHEIELGSAAVQASKKFYGETLGLDLAVENDGLNVFQSGAANVDFNTSAHFPQGVVCISFLTDDLTGIEKRLVTAGISYEGPKLSHLGMTCIQFNDPDGYLVKINSQH